MRSPVKQSTLDALAVQINRATGRPPAPYRRTPSGFERCPRAFYVAQGAAGVYLAEMLPEGGEGAPLADLEQHPRRVMLYILRAMLAGVAEGRAAQDAAARDDFAAVREIIRYGRETSAYAALMDAAAALPPVVLIGFALDAIDALHGADNGDGRALINPDDFDSSDTSDRLREAFERLPLPEFVESLPCDSCGLIEDHYPKCEEN